MSAQKVVPPTPEPGRTEGQRGRRLFCRFLEWKKEKEKERARGLREQVPLERFCLRSLALPFKSRKRAGGEG